jgi:zinc and cadmium transporter
MSITWLFAITSVLLVSLLSLVGVVALSLSERRLHQAVFLLVSLAAGAMFGDAFIHLLPEAYVRSGGEGRTALSVLAGIFAFFVLEKFLRWRHEHPYRPDHAPQPLAYVNLVADGVHNLVDGMLIGASYLVSLPLGIATTAAVVLHEIPQEIGDFGVLLHAGFSRERALLLNSLSASLAIAGAILALVAGLALDGFSAFMLPFTAGSFIYVAGSDLLPELHKERQPLRSAAQLVAMATGVGLMLLLTRLK